MKTKKYSSFEQIEIDLEILKLEKEIHFQKIIWSGQKIKENFALPSLAFGLLTSYKSILSNSSSALLQTVIPLIIKGLKKKRDN